MHLDSALPRVRYLTEKTWGIIPFCTDKGIHIYD